MLSQEQGRFQLIFWENFISSMQHLGYSQLIPYGAAKITPDEAKKIEFERKAKYCYQMVALCRKKSEVNE